MKCLVTGAAGYIGNALVQKLTKQHHNVRAVLHTSQPPQQQTDVDYVTADITKKESLQNIIDDIDVIYQCAAYVKDYGPKHLFYSINLQGTKNLVECAKNNPIQRFIFLGHIHYESKTTGYYSQTKKLAEDYLLNHYNKDKFPVVIIRPGNVFGPGATTWVQRPLEAIANNRIALINNGTGLFHHTYIDNLLDALLSAMTEPKALGECINITDGDNTTTWKQYLNTLSEYCGKGEITKNYSAPTIKIVGHLMLVGNKLFNITPWITPTAIEIFTNTNLVSIEKAQKILGYTPKVEYETAMKNIKEWIQKQEHLP